MAIDIGAELNEWFLSPETRQKIEDLVRGVVRTEFRKVLDEELLDVDQAAALLRMSPAAVRKAVEREQLPCVRIGRRIRFRRSELLRTGTLPE